MENEYFTGKEILSQPEVWAEVEKEVDKVKKNLKHLFSSGDYNKVIFTGCGSSYYLAIAAGRIFSHLTEKNSLALPASELLLYPEIYLQKDKNYLLVPISRSGESTETVDALRKVKENYRAKILGVSCYGESTLVKNSDVAIVLPGAKEKSVVMTRSFTSMLMSLGFTSSILADKIKFYQEFQKLPDLAREVIDRYKKFCEEAIQTSRCDKFVYLGSGPLYGIACEGSLKMKEMANLSCEVYHILEYIHGPKSNADEKTMIFLLLPERKNEYLIKFLKEISSLGVQIFIECERITLDLKNGEKYTLEVNSGLSDYARGLLYMIPLQLVAFYNTLKRDLNPDKPRNLTQVVRY